MVSPSRSKADGVFGRQSLTTGNNDFNALMFVIRQVLSQVNVATLVEVVAVHTTGQVDAVGTVDIRPLVHQVDGYGDPIPHVTIFGVPFFRLQGGANAVICDPQVGDVGFCVFADQDISNVKDTGTAALPGSARRFDYSDGLYLGGWSRNVTPQCYILVDDAGISLVAGASAELTATTFTINANVVINGTISTTGVADFAQDVTVGPSNLSMLNHKHPGVTSGGAITGGPV